MQLMDNGVGFEAQSKDGFGLKGITERLNKFGGRLEIDAKSGTNVLISVPKKDIE